MSAVAPPHRAKLEQAFRLYRRRIARCRTPNQVNRVHIAVENYMTPAEARYFDAALAAEPPDSAGRTWIARLVSRLPTNAARPVEFERRGILKGVTRYTAAAGSPEQKTLILAFAAVGHRLMLPTASWLDCLNPALYDLLLLRDFSRRCFSKGIPGLGGDFFEVLANLRRYVDPRAYRRTVALGTSAGGLPAVLAAIALKLDRAVSIGGMDFPELANRLAGYGVSAEPYAALLASRPEPYPRVLLVCCSGHAADVAAASALHQRLPSRLWPVNCDEHNPLASKFRQGHLPVFLSKALGRNVESGEPPDHPPGARATGHRAPAADPVILPD